MSDDPRRKSGLSGLFGVLTRAKSDVTTRRPSTAERSVVDPFERMDRPTRDIVRLMADIPVFTDLSERERTVIAEMAHVARCHGGTALWGSGERAHWLLMVVQGRIEMRANLLPGVEHQVRVHLPGDVLGIEALFGSETYSLGAFASERTAVLRIPIVELRQFLEVGRPAAIKVYVAIVAALGMQVLDATMEVAKLLERTSIMPSRGEGISESVLSDLLSKKP